MLIDLTGKRWGIHGDMLLKKLIINLIL